MSRIEIMVIVGACATLTWGCSAPYATPEPDTGNLVEVDDEPAGPNCPAGGLAVCVGEDGDGDGRIDDCQGQTRYVCHGESGRDGVDGEVGSSGLDCWDLDANGVCELENEDADGDGECTALDCRVPLDLPLALYTKTLMRAQNGGWNTFVRGLPGQSCDEICGGVVGNGFVGLPCAGTWCEGHAIPRDTPPYRDPYLAYSCAEPEPFSGCVPACMCSLGGFGHPDAVLSLPPGATFW